MPILSTIGAISSKAWGFARAVVAVADPLWNYVSLLLSSTTPSGGSTINSDASTNNFLLTPSGVPYNSVTNPFQAGYYGNQFNSATSDYLSTPYNAALAFGANNFTVECWIYPTAAITSTQHIIGSWDGSTTLAWQLNVASSNLFSFAWTTTGSYNASLNPASGSVIAINAWNHIAAVRNGSTVTIYLNGVSQASAAISGSVFNPSLPFKIGNNTNSQPFLGYVSNARVVNGTAVYTGNFTPSTTPLTAITNTALLTCQSARFVDNSTNAFVLTPSGSPKISQNQPFTYLTPTAYASEYFNIASVDYLSIPSTSNLAFGTGDFCVEMWYYPPTISQATAGLFSNSLSAPGGDAQLEIQLATLGSYYPTLLGWSTTFLTSSTASTFNAWNHLVVCRSGTTASMFLNGTRVATTTTSNNFSSTNAFYIGRQAASTSTTFTGYISNLRAVKGSSVYNPALTTLTVPTAPLTAITNTSLLSLQNNIPATNNGFVDSSALLNPITRTGTPTQGSFAPFGTLWSNYFSGTSDYLSAPTSAGFTLGTGDFTIELWMYSNDVSTAQKGPFQISGTAGGLSTTYTGGIALIQGANGASSLAGCLTVNLNGSYLSPGTAVLSVNTWYHVAIVRSGSTVTLYLNGVSIASGTNAGNITGTYLSLGGYYSTAYLFNGFISNFRVVKGTAVYTANFTPSTVPLTAITNTSLLTAQSNRFVDNSTNALTLTTAGAPKVQTFNPFLPTTVYSTAVQGGSAYFNGSSDYLSIPNSAPLNLSSGSWTIESWIYPINFTNYNLIVAKRLVSNATTSYQLYLLVTSGYLSFYNGTTTYSSTTAPTLNAWSHVAAVYNGTTLTLYLNGINVYSSAVTITEQNSTLLIGYDLNASDYFTGYISNVRIVKGTAVYTANFTPPTAPLSPVTNTSLLLNTANAGLFDYALGNDLVTIGSTTASTSTIKYGTGSLYFNGTSNYLTAPNNLPFVLGTGDFTIECWVYTNSSATQRIISVGNIGGAPYDFVLVNSSTNVYVDFFDGTTDITTGTNYVTQNQWVYLAVTRQGTAVKVFINGALSGSGTSSVNLTANGTVTIGRYSQAASGYFSGYISDLRITKGVARYTAAFTPPTAALPNY